MASSNTANWPVYSRKRKANVEELSWWFQGPKYLQFALRATRTHLTPTSYQQSRQLFIRHKLARQSKIRELLLGEKKKPKSSSWERSDGLWLTAMPFAQSASSKLRTGETAGDPGCRRFSKSKCITASQPRNSGIDPKNAAPQWGRRGGKLSKHAGVFRFRLTKCPFGVSEVCYRLAENQICLILKSCLWNNQASTPEDESMPSDLFRDVWYAVIFDCFLIYARGDRMSSYLFNTFLWHDWGCWMICNVFINVHICSQLLKHYKSLISSCLPCCCGFCRSSVSDLVPSSGQNAESIIYQVFNEGD